MKRFNKSILALALGSVLVISGCSDGKDGAPGAPGEPGAPGTPGEPYVPVTDSSEVTNVKFISQLIEEGKITVEFEITNEDGTLITGLETAGLFVAEMTEDGIQMAPDASVGGKVFVGGSKHTEGAELEVVGDGHYQFVAPLASVSVSDDPLIRLEVAYDDASIAPSPYIIIDKPENSHTTTTESCYACHVDYATSSITHSTKVAYDVDGNVDFLGGCLVCHNNLAGSKDSDGNKQGPGYAQNTMQKLGHINHQKFERDFAVTNCYTCHATEVMNTSITGNGCSDCHGGEVAGQRMAIQSTSDVDVRELHASAAGVTERKQWRADHSTTTGSPYFDETYQYDGGTGGYCFDIKLWDNSDDEPKQVNIKALYEAGKLTYTGGYINGYDLESDSILGRIVDRNDGGYGYYDREDGTRSVCYSYLYYPSDLTKGFTHLSANSRLTYMDSKWGDDASYDGVTLSSHADPVAYDSETEEFTEVGEKFDRRQLVNADACTTCHNNDTNYHKNGSYNDGGRGCLACHNNGYDRSSGNSAPGFGPMIHSMHWGEGSELSGEPNSAARLNADNCVSCHKGGVDLYAVPNRYMLSRAFNEGASGVMSSPVLSNCFACHNSDSALNHMKQNGGELNETAAEGWYNVPTAESCATCHAEGKSFGIELYHNF